MERLESIGSRACQKNLCMCKPFTFGVLAFFSCEVQQEHCTPSGVLRGTLLLYKMHTLRSTTIWCIDNVAQKSILNMVTGPESKHCDATGTECTLGTI